MNSFEQTNYQFKFKMNRFFDPKNSANNRKTSKKQGSTCLDILKLYIIIFLIQNQEQHEKSYVGLTLEGVFLVMLETSWYPVRQEVFTCFPVFQSCLAGNELVALLKLQPLGSVSPTLLPKAQMHRHFGMWHKKHYSILQLNYNQLYKRTNA